MTPSKIEWPSAQRQTAFAQWLAGLTGAWALEADTLAPASADASFRRYLRIQGQQHGRACNFIVMDAPPPQEDVRPFVRIGALIRQAGLHAPEVLAADEHNGFLLLEDLGGTLYLKAMQAEPATGPGSVTMRLRGIQSRCTATTGCARALSISRRLTRSQWPCCSAVQSVPNSCLTHHWGNSSSSRRSTASS